MLPQAEVPPTDQYDQVIEWLDENVDGDFATTLEFHFGHVDFPSLFEDGSWVHGNYSGCIAGQPCDSEGDFRQANKSCKIRESVFNEALNAVHVDYVCASDGLQVILEWDEGEYYFEEDIVRVKLLWGSDSDASEDVPSNSSSEDDGNDKKPRNRHRHRKGNAEQNGRTNRKGQKQKNPVTRRPLRRPSCVH